MLTRMLTVMLVVASILFAASGCANTTGRKIDSVSVEKIQKGVTSRSEVESAIGAPSYVNLLPDGQRSAIYIHYEARGDTMSYVPYINMFAGGIKSKKQNLQIIYDNKNIVVDYEFSEASDHSSGGAFGGGWN